MTEPGAVFHDKPSVAETSRSHMPAPRSSPRRVSYGVELLLLSGLAILFLWQAFVPAWQSLNTDFPNYYLAAKLYREGYPLHRVYDWIWFQRQKDHAGIDRPVVGFSPLTPFSLLPMVPLSHLPALRAKHYWLIFNLFLLGLTSALLNSMTGLGIRRTSILALLAFDPLRTSFLYGQEHILVLFLMTLAGWAYLRGKPGTSGAILALGSAIKIYPGLFLFYFARKRDWRAVAGLITACIALALISLQLFGLATLRVYVVEVLPRAMQGESNNPYSVAWSSFTALWHRLLIAEPAWNPHPVIHFPAAYAILQSLCQALLFVPCLWLLRSSRDEPARVKLEWGSYVALLLVLSPNPAPYQYCVLILTAALVADSLLRANHLWRLWVFVILYAVVSLPLDQFAPLSPDRWRTLAAFPKLYALAILWIFMLLALKNRGHEGDCLRLRSGEGVAFVCVFLAFVTAGTFSNLRHLKGQFSNYQTRLPVARVSPLAADPAIDGDRLFFTTMTATGYRTTAWDRGSLKDLPLSADTFHPAVALALNQGWVEVCDRQSFLVPFVIGDAASSVREATVGIRDAEQPSISYDGEWLAFVREVRGRGTLWAKRLGMNGDDTRDSVGEEELADEAYDVCDVAFFPDHRLVFAAQCDGLSTLFVADPHSHRVTPFPISSRPVRFPAVSPDAHWLAYADQEKGAWHLWLMKLDTRETRRLTNGDCNSVMPAWYGDSKSLAYATDCGRAWGMTALCRINVVP